MLTIIVPFFDETIYLRNALNSIRAQRIDELQIIVVNDNPAEFDAQTMATLGVTGDIELIQHPRNLGLSAARNSGIAQARGRFIGFLDSDDYYTLGGLAHQLERACNTGADMTHAQTWYTQLGSSRPIILPRDASFFAKPVSKQGLKAVEQAQFITSSWSSLYARSFLERNELKFDQAQTRFEDRLFVLSAVTRANTITFTGQPNRVWRRRAGSISVTQTTPDTHLLQVQLLEKCLRLVRAEVGAGRLKPVFEKRELFNTVSRLIWDMDLLQAINTSDDPIYQTMAQRIRELLGSDSFGQGIFGDKILAPISRAGMTTQKGRITRTTFFAIHRALRDGDVAAACRQIEDCSVSSGPSTPSKNGVSAPRGLPSPVQLGHQPARRLVLHLGLHKTGTTFVQHHLMAHRDHLLRQNILVPLTGFEGAQSQLRTGATPGHQGLVRALHRENSDMWSDLRREIAASDAHTVVISCENLGFPTLAQRDDRIASLAHHLGGFDQVDLIVMARRADTYVEALYRERVANGVRVTGAGLPGFVADYGNLLCDFPAFFAPFEAGFDSRVTFGNFDALAASGTIWQGFTDLAGLLSEGLPALDVQRYPTPDRESIQMLHLLNTLVPNAELRTQIIAGWFSLHPAPVSDASLLSPEQRLALLGTWRKTSASFARARGYSPDLDVARNELNSEDWTPPDTITAAHLSELIDLSHQAAGPVSPRSKGGSASKDHASGRRVGDMSLTIRLRPWAAILVNRIQSLTRSH